MAKSKKLSNPFSTGGGGVHFEAHVQASFVALMLTGGHAPCLPCWPIVEIKLQGKIDGFDTDDLVVVVENESTKERRKLLGQVKHSINITHGSALFGEVMQAAWNDFKDPRVFYKNDAIALITGPINFTDSHNVQWLLNQAKCTSGPDEFFRNVYEANFSPSKSGEKLEVIHHHLNVANGGVEIEKEELYRFLKIFHLLGYDLGGEAGVVLSLLHSHISLFQNDYPQWVWARVVDVVQTWNQDAGNITSENLPEDLRNAFKKRAYRMMPDDLKPIVERQRINWVEHPDATYLALAALIGSWSENHSSDLDAVAEFLGIDYKSWVVKAREILVCADSPLTLKNGFWKVEGRVELLRSLGPRVFDQNLDAFRKLAVVVLSEPDPAFELPPDERYAASVYGKVTLHSAAIRKGISEGLAILGANEGLFINCSFGKVRVICALAIRDVFSSAEFVLWGSLNSLLPTLSEAHPEEFLESVERALLEDPCPFDELFSQEGDGITGGSYMTGVLWALEGLAWEESLFVRSCTVLGELASHDPGGKWANRPSNSLAAILLPWYPQTRASIEKRQAAMSALIREWEAIAWELLLKLLPGHRQTSSGTHKPNWRNPVPDGWEVVVSNEEYWQQVVFYGERAVELSSNDSFRLAVLIEHFDRLPEPAFNKLIKVLESQVVNGFNEDQRTLIWNNLEKISKRHRKYSDAEWALPSEFIDRIEAVAVRFTPADCGRANKRLFSDDDYELYEEEGDWDAARKKLDVKREAVIREIYSISGMEGVIRFAESTTSPHMVGYALGGVLDFESECEVIPGLLSSVERKLNSLAGGFIWRKFQAEGWVWCDGLDKSYWSSEQVAAFLISLPFESETWKRAAEWLDGELGEYWCKVPANSYPTDKNLSVAIDNLIRFGRPQAAISCLGRVLHFNKDVDVSQSVRALIEGVSSDEPRNSMSTHHVIELIKYLQADSEVSPEDVFKVEWAYLPLLDGYRGVSPKFLNKKLASDPGFFCDVLGLIYRSRNDDSVESESSEEVKSIASNAWKLLHRWNVVPGVDDDGCFNGQFFLGWLKHVSSTTKDNGRYEVAMSTVGGVLIHSPADPAGLWIHHSIAEALNGRDAEAMRRGYEIETYNSRGARWVDPTGKPERELAEQFRNKAEQVENAGYSRFAGVLRHLADGYDHEAERVIADHGIPGGV